MLLKLVRQCWQLFSRLERSLYNISICFVQSQMESHNFHSSSQYYLNRLCRYIYYYFMLIILIQIAICIFLQFPIVSKFLLYFMQIHNNIHIIFRVELDSQITHNTNRWLLCMFGSSCINLKGFFSLFFSSFCNSIHVFITGITYCFAIAIILQLVSHNFFSVTCKQALYIYFQQVISCKLDHYKKQLTS
eukprot:TRINITY_DN36977_c1_g1_i2.p1 TRINITY_DN36977_c1_g1~~TRINITY_DN36977_c1_g1_i2.p1  ORF type:complete len:190 (-),score=-22.04 TRINITY_DN36977_c1_g1_i2:146-715(-)